MHRLDLAMTTLLRPRPIGKRGNKPRWMAARGGIGLRTMFLWVLIIGCVIMLSSSTLPAFESPLAQAVSKTTGQKKRSFPGAKKVILSRQAVKPRNGKLMLRVKLLLPKGFKINPAAPMGYLLETVGQSGPVDRSKPSNYQLVKPPQESFDLVVPVVGTGDEQLRLSMNYYHCQGDPTSGTCQTGSVILDIPFKVDAEAEKNLVEVNYKVPAF